MSQEPVTPTPAASSAAHGETHPTTDVVADAIARVKADLERRRANGELPEFTPHEMRRHFDAVVEAYEGALLEIPPIELDSIRGGRVITGNVESSSRIPGGTVMHRVIAKAVRRQTAGLAEQMRAFATVLVDRMEDLADRQDRMRRFLLVAHLDRIRQLEYRVAQLELQLERQKAELELQIERQKAELEVQLERQKPDAHDPAVDA